MKKFTLALVACLVALSSFGQAKVEIGIKGGLNLSSLSTDAAGTYSSRTGFHGGAYGLIKLANLGIQPEVLYSAQGSSIDISGVQDDLMSDLVYLNIPVMLKLYLVAGLNLQLGPQFGVLVSAEQEDFDITTGQVSGTSDIKDQLKNSDLSAALGAGWDAPFGLSFTARYIIGLNDINDIGAGSDTKNRTFQVSLGYRLFKVGR